MHKIYWSNLFRMFETSKTMHRNRLNSKWFMQILINCSYRRIRVRQCIRNRLRIRIQNRFSNVLIKCFRLIFQNDFDDIRRKIRKRFDNHARKFNFSCCFFKWLNIVNVQLKFRNCWCEWFFKIHFRDYRESSKVIRKKFDLIANRENRHVKNENQIQNDIFNCSKI